MCAGLIGAKFYLPAPKAQCEHLEVTWNASVRHIEYIAVVTGKGSPRVIFRQEESRNAKRNSSRGDTQSKDPVTFDSGTSSSKHRPTARVQKAKKCHFPGIVETDEMNPGGDGCAGIPLSCLRACGVCEDGKVNRGLRHDHLE